MNVSQAHDAAADYIQTHGWFRCGGNEYRDPGPNRACALVALVHCCDVDGHAVGVFAKALGHDGGTGQGRHVADWNNAPDRTKAEVIAMLRAVAAVERARAARLLPVVRERVSV